MKSKYLIALLMMLGLVTFAGYQARAESGSGSDGDSSDDASETEDSDDASDDSSEDDNESDDSGMDSASDLDDSDEDTSSDDDMFDDSDMKPRPINAGPGSYNSGPGSFNSGKPVVAPRPGVPAAPFAQKIISEHRPSILENMEARKKFEEENGVAPKPGFFNERAQERMSEEARLRLEERFKNEAPREARTRVHENFGRMIGNFDNIIPRIESRLAKMEEMGIDTTGVDSALDDVKSAIDEAKKTQEELAALFASETATKEELEVAGGALKASLQAVHETLKAVVEAMKATVEEARATTGSDDSADAAV